MIERRNAGMKDLITKDLLTIQEFSKLTGVEASKLRFYDDIGLFSPIMRNPENNYRYYSLAQIFSLNFISVLSDLNIPLKKIAELRKERTPSELLKLIEKLEKQMDLEMIALRERYSIVHARRELINYGMIVANGFTAVNGIRTAEGEPVEGGIKVDENVISVLYRDDKEYILWPRNEYGEGETFVQAIAEFINQAGERHINLSFPVGGYYDNMESFINNPRQPEHFFTIDPIGKGVRKEGKYLIGFNRGYYGEMGNLPERMKTYANEHSLIISGPVYVMYLFDEICTQDPSQFLVQACVAVSKPKRRAAKS